MTNIAGEPPPVPDSPPATLLRPIVGITAATVGVHAVSLLLQVVMARLFGAGPELDAFFSALALPQYVGAIVAGALAPVCVPVIVGAMHRDGLDEALRVAQGITNVALAAMFVVAAAGALFASPLLHLSAPGLSPAIHAEATRMARVLWPTILGTTAVTLATGIENSRERFLWPALVPLAGGIANLVLLVALARPLGAFGAAVATTAGLLVQFALFARALFARRGGLRELAMRPGTREAFALFWPLLASGVFARIFIVAERYFGSQLAAGSVAEISYASRLVAPLALLLSTGIATVVFPRMARNAASGSWEELGLDFSAAVRSMWVLIAPVMLIGIALARPAIGALFQGGRFTAADADRVAALLQVYFLSVAASAIGTLTGRMLYSLKASRLLAIAAVLESVAYVLYTAFLVRRLGAAGVAWGFVAYVSLSIVWHVAAIRQMIRWTRLGATSLSLLRTTVAALAGAATARVIVTHVAGVWGQTLAGGAAAVVVFAAAFFVVNRPDARAFVTAMRR